MTGHPLQISAGRHQRARWAILPFAAILVTSVHPVWAHAFLQRAAPAVGSELSASPASITLTYTEPVEPVFSSVLITDPSGVRVDAGKPASQDDGRVLIVPLKPIGPGVYTVTWHVTSVDTHKTEGHFTFTIRP